MVLRILEYFVNGVRDEKNTTARLYVSENEFWADTFCSIIFDAGIGALDVMNTEETEDYYRNKIKNCLDEFDQEKLLDTIIEVTIRAKNSL